MRVKAEVDMGELKRSLDSASRRFGDTTRQAVARWGVQTARELAVETRIFGKAASKTRKPQQEHIALGVNAAVYAVSARDFKRTAKDRRLSSPGEIDAWIERNRRSRGHVRKLRPAEKKVAKKSDVNKVIRARKKHAGMAKGAWLGAGQKIAKAQTGANQIRIGKNFLGYAQKHSGLGAVRKKFGGFRPHADLVNKARHSGSRYVMKSSAVRRARLWGLRKTIKWYNRAAKEALDKA